MSKQLHALVQVSKRTNVVVERSRCSSSAMDGFVATAQHSVKEEEAG